jgi:hypothetical protein
VLDGDPSIRHRIVDDGKDPVGSIDSHAGVSAPTRDLEPVTDSLRSTHPLPSSAARGVTA